VLILDRWGRWQLGREIDGRWRLRRRHGRDRDLDPTFRRRQAAQVDVFSVGCTDLDVNCSFDLEIPGRANYEIEILCSEADWARAR
jgi:hypothetical protein